MIKYAALPVVLTASLCLAASRCPDPRLQDATIGGNRIIGYVVLHKKPLKFARMRLYSASGETAWIGKTDKDGGFSTTQLPPGGYRLEVSGWGIAKVRLNPELDKGPFGQIPAWSLLLIDNSCVSTIQIMN